MKRFPNWLSRPYLELEPLEVRLTPALSLNFFHPRALVAVNPQPLPPSALVLFDPQPVPLQSPGPATGTTPVHLEGHDLVAATGPTALDYAFNLDGLVTEQPPGPDAAPGAYDATFNLAGTVTETLAARGSPGPWQINTTVAVAGFLSGTVKHPQPANNDYTVVDFTFRQITVEHQDQHNLPGDEWDAQTDTTTSGSGTETLHPPSPATPPGAVAGSFARQDQFHQVLTAVAVPPGEHPPNPCVIDGTYVGTMSLGGHLIPPGPTPDPPAPCRLIGISREAGQLTQTTTFPAPGPSAPPPSETTAIELQSYGAFDEALRGQ
jgi:hypothetical protein